jgi:hypothetical protein
MMAGLEPHKTFGSLYSLAGMIVCLLSRPWEEEGASWVLVAPVFPDPAMATTKQFLVGAEDSSLGQPLTVALETEIVISTEQLGWRLGGLTDEAKEILEHALDQGLPEEWAGRLEAGASPELIQAQLERDAFANRVQVPWAEAMLTHEVEEEARPATYPGALWSVLTDVARRAVAGAAEGMILQPVSVRGGVSADPNDDEVQLRSDSGEARALAYVQGNEVILDLDGLPESWEGQSVRIEVPAGQQAAILWREEPGVVTAVVAEGRVRVVCGEKINDVRLELGGLVGGSVVTPQGSTGPPA